MALFSYGCIASMEATITISGKLLGRTKSLFPDWCIPLPPEFARGKHLTLRELLTRIVLAEVKSFRTRSEQRRLTRVLTKTEIASALKKGKVDMGGRDLEQEVEPQAAVDSALQAFEDGFYFVFIDDEQQEDLEAEVYLHSESRVTFLRLVPLVGG